MGQNTQRYFLQREAGQKISRRRVTERDGREILYVCVKYQSYYEMCKVEMKNHV